MDSSSARSPKSTGPAARVRVGKKISRRSCNASSTTSASQENATRPSVDSAVPSMSLEVTSAGF